MNKRDHPKKWNTYKDIKNKTQKYSQPNDKISEHGSIIT